MALADFRYVMRFRVPYGDIDMLQHVNHAAYIVWAETVRGAYFADVLGESVGGRSGIIMARLEFHYERPLDYREDVIVGCRIARFGRKSFDFVHEIWSETTDTGPHAAYAHWLHTTTKPKHQRSSRNGGGKSSQLTKS